MTRKGYRVVHPGTSVCFLGGGGGLEYAILLGISEQSSPENVQRSLFSTFKREFVVLIHCLTTPNPAYIPWQPLVLGDWGGGDDHCAIWSLGSKMMAPEFSMWARKQRNVPPASDAGRPCGASPSLERLLCTAFRGAVNVQRSRDTCWAQHLHQGVAFHTDLHVCSAGFNSRCRGVLDPCFSFSRCSALDADCMLCVGVCRGPFQMGYASRFRSWSDDHVLSVSQAIEQMQFTVSMTSYSW